MDKVTTFNVTGGAFSTKVTDISPRSWLGPEQS